MVRLSQGLFKPKHRIPGIDIAGQVEAVGKDVRQVAVDTHGKSMFGTTTNTPLLHLRTKWNAARLTPILN